jgi:hypothetical protein
VRTLSSAFGALFFGFLFRATLIMGLGSKGIKGLNESTESTEPAETELSSFFGVDFLISVPFLVASMLYAVAGVYYLGIFKIWAGSKGGEWEPNAMEAAAAKEAAREVAREGRDGREGMRGGDRGGDRGGMDGEGYDDERMYEGDVSMSRVHQPYNAVI